MSLYISINANAEEINLNGRVVDEQSTPLSGVKVYLETANLTAYSDANGNFSFVQSDPTPSALETNMSNSERISFDGNKLLIEGDNNQVLIDLYDITGKFIKRLVNENNLSGSYALYPKAYLQNEPHSVYLIRAVLNGELFGYKVSKMYGTTFSQGLHAANNSASSITGYNYKSTLAVDHITLTYSSYVTKQITINNYIANLGDVVMESEVVVVDAPVLTGPSTTYTSFELSWNYNWTRNQNSDDHYELEYSYQPNSGFQALIVYPNGDRATPHSEVLYPEAQDIGTTTYFRIRAKSGGTYSEYSNVVGVYCPQFEQTFFASFDNGVAIQSNDATVADKNYKNSTFMVGAWYQYNLGGFTEYFITSSALYFNIMNFIEGKTIQKATLKLYVKSIAADFNTKYKIRALAGDWNTNTLTYNNMPQIYPNPKVVKDLPVTGAVPWEVDITSIVQAWANGTLQNKGILIEDNSIAWPGYTAIRITEFYSIETAPNSNSKPQLYLEIK